MSGATPALLSQRVLPAPTTAALERYALMPINEAAGTPAISIPLYEVHSGQLVLPITASYHASGIQVADAASWLGLGWALNAGGVITRLVNGGPDENVGGFREHPGQVPRADTLTYLKQLDFLNRVTAHNLDYLPDLYTFNMVGQAGTFMQGNDGAYHLLPLQPVHVALLDTAFQLTDAHGVQYFFASKEYVTLLPRASDDKHYISSWYLDRIVSADRADTIRLEYTPGFSESTSTQQQQTRLTAAPNYNHAPSTALSEVFTETTTYIHHSTLQLRRIVFKTGVVVLNFTKDRRDSKWDPRLLSLTVLSRDLQDTLKHVHFFHSYFSRQGPDTTRTEKFSLCLDSLQTSSMGLRIPPYRFTYNTSVPLATRTGGSRDHWGYHNGAGVVNSPKGTGLLIPTTTITTYYGTQVYAGANRNPNPAYVRAGTLTQIRYPTGGRQRFTYEPNTLPASYRVRNPRTTVQLGVTAFVDSTGNPTTIRQLTFQITNDVTVDTCLVNISGLGQVHSTGVVALTDITVSANPTLVTSWSGSSVHYNNNGIQLQAGHTYQIRITVRDKASASFLLTYEAKTSTYAVHNVLTGGIRVREEQLQAREQAPISYRRYYYKKLASALSSGYAIRNTTPIYSRLQTSIYPYQPVDDPSDPHSRPIELEGVTHTLLSSSSLVDVAGGERIVGYGCVSVVDSSATGQTNGRTVSLYQQAPDATGGWLPPIPSTSHSWQRDQLRNQRVYAAPQVGSRTTSGILLSRLEHDYVLRDSVLITGFTAAPDVSISGDLSRAYNESNLRVYAWANTRQISGWQYLRQTRQYQYAPGDTTSVHLTTTTYRYDNPAHQQPTLVETDLASGQHQQVRARYVADFDTLQVTAASPAPVRALRELSRLHAPAQLVEQTTLCTTPTDTLVTRSQLTLWRVLAPGVVVPGRQLALRTSVPLLGRRFTAAHLQGGQLYSDAHYESRLFVDRYAVDRQPAQTHLAEGLPTAYLWDTYTKQPLAQANAALTQLAVTSFEPGAAGQWAYDQHRGLGQHLVAGAGRTGTWAYRLDSGWPIRRDSLPAGEYLLRCWYQGPQLPQVVGTAGTPLGSFQAIGPANGSWHAAQLRLHLAATGPVQVSAPSSGIAVLVDDLVLSPVDAQLTTYTYDALRGLSSQTGPDGRTLTYEYDALGRLVRTRDEQGRILSQQQYHYVGQP